MKTYETKPFRSPLFSGFRIRLRMVGGYKAEIVNNTTNRVIALVNKGNGTVTFLNDGKGKPESQRLTKFFASDFAPLMNRLTAQFNADRRAEREVKQMVKQDAAKAAEQAFIAGLTADQRNRENAKALGVQAAA